MRFVRVTRGTPGSLNSEGLEPLRLALWDNGKEVDSVLAYSGAPGAQNFRTLRNERRGLLEPIPEGTYTDIGGLEWNNGEDNYNDYWSSSLGPVVIEIYGERAIMLHLDANRVYAPGSAGCLCPVDFAGLKKVVSWWKAGRPKYVECDWGLGTIKRPETPAGPVTKKVKLFFNNNKCTAYKQDEVISALKLKFDYNNSKLGVALNDVVIGNIKNVQVILQYE